MIMIGNRISNLPVEFELDHDDDRPGRSRSGMPPSPQVNGDATATASHEAASGEPSVWQVRCGGFLPQ